MLAQNTAVVWGSMLVLAQISAVVWGVNVVSLGFQPTLERQTVVKMEHEGMPETGEGSEYGRKRREEARKRRRGYRLRTLDPDDQPWILREKKKGGKQLSLVCVCVCV